MGSGEQERYRAKGQVENGPGKGEPEREEDDGWLSEEKI
jgi:hypothetical protein